MAGIVPVVPLQRSRQVRASRLVDRHPSSSLDAGQGHGLKRQRWGSVSVLSHGGGHRVERLTVEAGCTMPVHYHNHRSEHWTIVSGEAEVVLGDDVMIASPDDSLYIPAGTAHGLKAGGDNAVTLVAVHFGDLVSDDDDLIITG